MAQRNDQIFQISLTEIAFCIAFILLLLLGYLVIKEQDARKEVQEALAQVESNDETKRLLEGARFALVAELGKVGASEDVITKLIEAHKLREERDHLRQQVKDLDAKLTVLTELAGDMGTTLGTVKQAIATTKMLHEQFKSKLGLEPTAATVVDVVDAAKSFGELSKDGVPLVRLHKENSDLRGQMAFLKKRLDARGGRDYPPCWANESGKVEFLFAIELLPDFITVTQAWPIKREADAKALPGITTALAQAHSYSSLPAAIQGIFNWSRTQDPECRHYVQIKSSIPDAVKSDRARLMVENYFYKVEARR